MPLRAAGIMPRAQRGGWGTSGSRHGEAAFLYMPHSAVVIHFESDRPLPTREKSCAESDPPQKPGGHAALDSGIVEHASTPGPMGSLSSSFIPAGRLRTPPFPSRFIVSDRSSPSRVRCAASRPGRLRADPKDALLTRERILSFTHRRQHDRQVSAARPQRQYVET